MEQNRQQRRSEVLLQLAGWILFLVGTALFIVSSARAGDRLSLAGSIAFLLGSLVFMQPLVVEMSRWLPRPKRNPLSYAGRWHRRGHPSKL